MREPHTDTWPEGRQGEQSTWKRARGRTGCVTLTSIRSCETSSSDNSCVTRARSPSYETSLAAAWASAKADLSSPCMVGASAAGAADWDSVVAFVPGADWDSSAMRSAPASV
eukprot:scaffold57702_cov27-Tisochrysis_lutea.AAC.3